jgi:haloalkane dehalogenase
VHAFDDCGHYILEDASDEVIPIIEQFLAANPLGQPAAASPDEKA